MSELIRRTPADHPTLVALHRLTFPHDVDPHWGSAAWWVAYDRLLAEPVAFFGIQRTQQWCDAGYIVRVGVVEAARGAGLQKRLMRLGERYARRVGWNWIVTDCTRDNYPSANSLIACGYRLFEPTEPWAARGALYWRKRLHRKTT